MYSTIPHSDENKCLGHQSPLFGIQSKKSEYFQTGYMLYVPQSAKIHTESVIKNPNRLIF